MFIGNTKAVKLLEKSMRNSRISHAYLFSGPENVGKLALAKIFSRGLILGKPLDLEINGKKNPFDMVILSPEIEEKKGITKEKDIKIENIRNLQKELSLFPYEGKYKILIVDNAHKLTVSSQNALLKILEEPNETSIIILVTHEESKIIPTIKSRCQKVNFSLVGVEEIKKNFEVNKELILFSMGKPGLIFGMMKNPEELEMRKKNLEIINSFSGLGVNKRFEIAENLAQNLAQGIKILEFWVWVVRNNIFENPGREDFFSFKTIEKMEKTMDTLKNTNANARLAIESLFLEI